MDLKRRKIRGEVNTAWTCELTRFLDQVAGLDEKLHYIIKNSLILSDDEDPAAYHVRVPGGTVGSIWLDVNHNIREIFIDTDYVVKSYPEDINEQVKKFVGERMNEDVLRREMPILRHL
mgnify:CR=1 FL=1